MKAKILSFLFLLSLGFFSGCIEDVEQTRVFRDQAQIEFDAIATNPNLIRNTNQGVGLRSEQVNLIAPHFTVDQTLTFRVFADETTATEGVHYRLVNNGTFVIPAGESFGTAQVELLPVSGMTAPVSLTIELVGNEAVRAAANYRLLTFNIRP
ncbi:hypothetical protein A3SI_11214 [Nitritalea halalkaliphila LW7]|uniref:DUF4843 domain-containing protein n=1 Tax=Nitritalea halalkaliphila LW7 TaxID=1189621 RepID=I5C294_9BACT|nr:hypothetical protein [Nitritalea halalkaliphila]EIM75946.1 hypothetical protein A3SI_11214 [Nitritalea halalkaliphila LW7]